MSENYTIGCLEIFGSKDENGNIEVTGLSVKIDPALKLVSSLARFLGTAASGATGVTALLPTLLPELLKIIEGLRSGALAEDDVGPPDMDTLIAMLSDFGLKIVKSDGSELTQEEIDAYGTSLFEDTEEPWDDDDDDESPSPPNPPAPQAVTDDEPAEASEPADEPTPV